MSPIISFLVVDVVENSLSKFESSQAEITAFFQKLLIPISTHRIHTPVDALNAIQSQNPKVFAIVDSPVRFPLTELLNHLQRYLEDPDAEDLFFMLPGTKHLQERTEQGNVGFLENVARSTLSPPNAPRTIECFAPLTLVRPEFAKRTQENFRQNPLWLRLALNLSAYADAEHIQAARSIFHGNITGSPIPPLGFLRTAKEWLAFQKLVQKSRST